MWFNNKWKSLTMKTIVNSKGKFIIPSEILKQLGIKDKAFLQVDVDAETRQIIITPLRGKYKGKGLMKAFMAKKDRERNAMA
jgi:bifunctional DNA-binding transcriptional regulator/antitoxin component of YhaV-PrlF toxin-antitoxin module